MMYTTRLTRYTLFGVTLGLLIGCTATPSPTVEDAEKESTISPETVSEPSTSDTQLTAEETNSQAENPAKDVSRTVSNLSPGRYCYQLNTDTQTLDLRLELDRNNQIDGDSRASIHNEASAYYTSYAQQFSGTLAGNTASINLTTWIEYDVQSDQQTWTLSQDVLTTDREEIPAADCALVDQAFQDINGLEAQDLLEGATTVHNQTLRFAPGTQSTTVSQSVIRGERDRYLLGAQGGQQMTLSITSTEDNAVFDVISPSGYILAVESTQETLFLPHNGDYQVIVGGTRGNATYELTVSIK
jgi:hypothetical protein